MVTAVRPQYAQRWKDSKISTMEEWLEKMAEFTEEATLFTEEATRVGRRQQIID